MIVIMKMPKLILDGILKNVEYNYPGKSFDICCIVMATFTVLTVLIDGMWQIYEMQKDNIT